MPTVLVELVGAPGAGKSTTAAEIFSELKHLGVNAELITEVAKEWAWEGRKIDFRNQTLLAATQLHRILNTADRADIVITDGSLQLSHWYAQQYGLPSQNAINGMLDEISMSMITRTYFIARDKPYVTAGRYHSEKESDLIGKLMAEYFMGGTAILTTTSSKAKSDITTNLAHAGFIP
jgi:adenylate kinase